LTLSPGSRLGAYEILSLLGAGGMGEVYRARDQRLNRQVALKVLPASVAADAERLARFEREAQVLAALNHPNIAAIYGVEDSGGTPALVMELVEGDTLADRIATGPIPLDEALPIARQIAEGLEAAHEQGIIHRDLKPANIKVRTDGLVKVLDFGLAKVLEPAAAEKATDAETLVTQRTQPGVVMGTVGYMSPEQVSGSVVDARSDIFSFGVVLYELLAGRRPFEGATNLERLWAVVHREFVPLGDIRDDLPDALLAIVDKTLRKDPADRYQTARNLVSDLRQVVRQPSEAAGSPVVIRKVRRLLILAGGLAGVAAAATVVTWLPLTTSRTRPAETMRLSVTLPVDQELNSDAGAGPLAISPDGRRVVYAAVQGATTRLYVRAFDAFESRALTGTEGAEYPFFSPDGESVGFFAGGKLLRISLDGGAPQKVCDVPILGRGATWGGDGTIVYDPGLSGLMRVPAEGGRPELLTSSDSSMDRRNFEWPQFLPDGDALLASLAGGSANQIMAFSFRTRQWQVVTDGMQPQYVPPRYLAYHAPHIREGELQAVEFDAKTLMVRGAPTSFLNGAFRARNGGAEYYAISRSGTLVFAPGGLGRTLVRVDRNGRRTPLSDDRRGFRFPRLSPNGAYVAVTIDPRPSGIWVYDLERGSRMPLATGRHNLVPLWTPDGKRVVYSATSATVVDLYSQPADGSSAAERLLEREGAQYAHSWSRDGRLLFFQDQGSPANKSDVWVLPSGGEARPILATPAGESHPAISPDSHWLAYQSDESGRLEIYVRPYPGVDTAKWPISTKGGHSPMWSNDGRELYYMDGQSLMATAVRVEDTKIIAGVPTVLFSGPFDTTQDNNYDVSADGHFIMVEAAPEATLHALQVVLNWSSDLKRLVSAKNIVN